MEIEDKEPTEEDIKRAKNNDTFSNILGWTILAVILFAMVYAYFNRTT